MRACILVIFIMPKFKITTLGCKVNQAESESIAQELRESDWFPAEAGQPADVCIVNTCTVTHKASMQSRQAVRQAVRANPTARILVTGCYAQTAPEEIKSIAGVSAIVGHDEKQTIGSMLRDVNHKCPEIRSSGCRDICQDRHFKLMPLATTAPRTRPFLKIQDGCDAFCTYCIVPYARGRSRSMPLETVLQRIDRLAEAGYHEVVLSGVHLGAYGRDLSPAVNLTVLLGRIEDSGRMDRVRLSSIEPLELTGEIIRRVAESEIFCRHFHVPLQSGDDGVLRKMGRPYSRQTFHDLIVQVHDAMPDAAIGVDTLIGFPGESEKAFENTFRLLEDLPVSYLHVFPFSERPGTAAAMFADKVQPETIKARCERMRRSGGIKRMNFYRKFIGKKLPVLIETKRDDPTGLMKGISSNYLPVLFEAGDVLKNKIVDVKIEKLEANRLFGVLCDK